MSESTHRTPVKMTPLMWFYAFCAGAGVVAPWYFNIRYMVESGEMISLQALIAAGFTNTLSSSLTIDFFIALTATLIWMMIEARRLKMRNAWFYFVATFLIAFAFACPFFLLMRERKLHADR